MPTLRFEAQLAAATTNANILAGSKFEILPFNSMVQVFAVQDGAGAGLLTMDLTMGNAIEIDGAVVPTVAAAGTGPERDKHLLGAGIARAHDRVQLKLVNAAGVPSNYRILVDIRPL